MWKGAKSWEIGDGYVLLYCGTLNDRKRAAIAVTERSSRGKIFLIVCAPVRTAAVSGDYLKRCRVSSACIEETRTWSLLMPLKRTQRQ